MRDTQSHEFSTVFRFPVDADPRSDIFTSQTVTTLLRSTLVEAPRPGHLFEGWLAPAVVVRLTAALMTPVLLLGLICRWHPRLDAKGRHKLEVQIAASLATMLR
ncbi:hypothetical protein [Burkholderia gladioli]|uniref:hypothetical protein n=1 Tax=Burkholderia gladioli TaxID=28095 RepID=UPI00163E408E|nr:hypothetical protein [Burkholderia gladioli]